MKYWAAIAILAIPAASVAAQTPDPGLMSEIRQIRAIDNHSHPPRVVGTNERDD